MYLNLKEIVAPGHTALVVWDMQNRLVQTAFNRDELLSNLTSLVGQARASEIPVVYAKNQPWPRHLESPFRVYMQMKRQGVRDPAGLPPLAPPGSPDYEITAGLSPQEGDIVLEKHTPDIFIGTPFENLMRRLHIDTLVFTGITTEMGIDSSARDSVARGFYTVIAADCVSSANRELHDCALKILRRVCLVVTGPELAGAWAEPLLPQT